MDKAARKVKPLESEESVALGDDLTKLPVFGMWADREDMKNPTEWVQHLRQVR